MKSSKSHQWGLLIALFVIICQIIPSTVSHPGCSYSHTYEAISAMDFNVSYHCGVVPDTNFELYIDPKKSKYGVHDIAPFGKYPWVVQITVKNKLICTGVLIQGQHVLTSSSCVPEYQSLSKFRVRVGDWDLLTNYNEYEAYQNLDYPICGRYPISDAYDTKSGYKAEADYKNKQYQKESGLVLLKIGDLINYDKRPHVKPICLSSNYEDSYNGDNTQYENNYYGGDKYKKMSDQPSHYTHPIYQGSKANSYSQSNCWVVGWYGTKKITLKNHPLPNGKTENYKNNYYNYYYQEYYKGYDKSFIQKRAKVKQIDCPTGSYYNNNNEDNSICFVGVEGYDACVADRGSGIFCVIPENEQANYDSGYTKPESYYGPTSQYPLENEDYYESYYPDQNQDQYTYGEEYGNAYGPYGPPYAPYANYRNDKDIKAYPSNSKPLRYRAVLYAIVQKTAKCDKNLFYYDNNYSKGKQSKLIRGTKVGYKAVKSILKTYWEIQGDKTCPVPLPKTQYKKPKQAYSYGSSNYKDKFYFKKY